MNYNEMTDFEINKRVAEALKYKISVELDGVWIVDVPEVTTSGLTQNAVGTFDECHRKITGMIMNGEQKRKLTTERLNTLLQRP